MTKQFERFAIVLGALSIAACGDSSSSPAPDAAADVSVDTGKHDSAVVSNPDTGTMTTPPVQCGTNMCMPPQSALAGLAGGLGGGMGGMAGGMGGMMGGMGGGLSACCLSDGGCGAGLGGLLGGGGGGGGDSGTPCLDTSPGTTDPTCPSQSILGFALTGCCSNAHICGVDLSIGGLGCNSTSFLGGIIPGGMMMDAGPPKTCGGDGGAEAGSEGGAGDAGDSGAGDGGASDSATDSGTQDAAHE